MRKLSKKISMLMVLAMLVSLFSGIVSASAASSWSFYDRTAEETVERNATYVMEKDQYANFDLYKDGAEASTKEYKYTWYSDDASVVYVDSTNGRLRAQKDAEAGEKAFIYVLIDNKTTEKNENAKRGFYIEIAADEVVEPTPTEAPEVIEYKIVTMTGDAVLGAETLEVGKLYELTTTVTANGEAVEAVISYATADGEPLTGGKISVNAEGEYTVVVTATIDDEVVKTETYTFTAEAGVPEFVDVQQTSLTTVEIKLNNADWAKKLVDNKALLKYSYFAGTVEISDLINKVEAKKDVADTIVVTAYSAFAADTTYKFAFDGYECEGTFVGTKAIPASIKVVGGSVIEGEYGNLGITIYTADGVDITEALKNSTVRYKVAESNDCIPVGDNQIYFFKAGVSVAVTAEYEMGWDENGNEITDLTATGVYHSVAAHSDSNLNGYALKASQASDANLNYGNAVELSVSDTGLYLHSRYTRTLANGTPEQKYVVGMSDTANKTGYTYLSTNEHVLFIDANGQLLPCNEGTTSIVIKRGNDTVGSVPVVVKKARTFSSLTASVTDKMVSVGTNYSDTTEITVVAKDQFLTDIPFDTIKDTYTVTLVDPATGNLSDYFTYSPAVNNNGVTKITLTPSNTATTSIPNDTAKNITLKVEAIVGGVTKTSNNVVVSLKNVNSAQAAAPQLQLSANSVDMKLNKGGAGDYNVTAKLVLKDTKGYDLGLQTYTYIASEAQAVTTNGEYSVIIIKNSNKSVVDIQNDANISMQNGVITFSPVKADGNGLVTKMTKDTYTIKVFKGNDKEAQPYATQTLSIQDSTTGLTVKAIKTNINGTIASDVKSALEFYRNGVKINSDLVTVNAIVPADYVQVQGSNKVFLKTIDVTIKNSEMNNNFAGTHVENDVVVNQLFTAQ